MERNEAELFDSLQQLDNTLRDTALDDPIDFAKQQNDILREDSRPIEARIADAIEVANFLDSEKWQILMDAQAIVTGWVSPVRHDDAYDSDYVWENDLSGDESQFFDDEELVSQGFIVVRDYDEVSLKLLMVQSETICTKLANLV